MGFYIVARLFDLEFRQRRLVGTGTGDQHVVDRCREFVEESFELIEVGGVERRAA
jgi:hypothetical protein